MAAKKPAEPAVKAVKSPAAGKHAAAAKAPAKKTAPVATAKPAAAKTAPAKKATNAPTAAKTAAAKKPAPAPARQAAAAKPAAKPASKPAPKPVAKTAPAKSAPAKVAGPSQASVVKTAATPAAKAVPAKNPVPAKTPPKTDKRPIPAKPAASRVTGKIAVAVTARAPETSSKPKVRKVEYTIDEATGRPVIPPGYRPQPDEEYMSPLQLEYFRQRLLDWRADLVEESKQTIENLKDEVRDVGDEAERATRETENSLELRTRDRYRKLIGKIDSTLKRLEAGDYGYCVDTGEEIGLERLEARLTAERTLDAQERWEHLQKQQGD